MIKKTVVAAAALAAMSGAAFAQSSVTLYGIVDANIAMSERHNGESVTGMNLYNPTNPRGPRFGFRGSEALGSGYKAVFQLEAGFSTSDGTTASGNQLFNRAAWAGISAPWGDVTMGRQDTLHRVANTGGYGDVTSEAELSVVTANSGLLLMQSFGSRVNNSVRYTSPAFNGVKVRVQSTFGKQAAIASMQGAMISFDQGPLKVALVHEYYAGTGIPGVSKWNEVTTVNAAYKFPFATLTAGAQQSRKVGGTTAPTSLGTSHDAYNLGAIVPVSKALSLRLQYTVSNTKTATSDREYSRAGVSARYAMSPRTFLYAVYSAKEVDVPTATDNKNSLGLGVSHAF